MSILPSLIVALALTQTIPSRDELAGASIVVRQDALNIGSIIVTNPEANRVCLSPANNTIPVGAVTIRVGVVILSTRGQEMLGWTLASNGIDPLTDTYAALEVQAAPSTQPIVTPPPDLDFLEDTEIVKVASPTFPTDGLGHNCQISIVRFGYPTVPWRCACAQIPATCSWTDPNDGKVKTPPKGLTLGPNAWSGAGCLQKTCVARMGTPSMPGVCQ